MSLLEFPGGKTKALTLSFDDARTYDRQLVAMLNRYGLKATFHIVTQWLDRDGYISARELPQLYQGHEVALHGHTHRPLGELSDREILLDVGENKRILEELTGDTVTGMSYPMGSFSPEKFPALRQAGVVYSRTTRATGGFGLPEELLAWHPTIHYARGTARYTPNATYPRTLLMEKTREFFQAEPGSLMYVWGHSYEFPEQDNWDVLEEFCQAVSSRSDIWFATNLEVADYIRSHRN